MIFFAQAFGWTPEQTLKLTPALASDILERYDEKLRLSQKGLPSSAAFGIDPLELLKKF